MKLRELEKRILRRLKVVKFTQCQKKVLYQTFVLCNPAKTAAKNLDCSVSSVKSHITSIYVKLSLHENLRYRRTNILTRVLAIDEALKLDDTHIMSTPPDCYEAKNETYSHVVTAPKGLK